VNDFEKSWIDNATFKELFAKVRFEPIDSPWFREDTGKYLMARYYRLRSETPQADYVRISKELGWK